MDDPVRALAEEHLGVPLLAGAFFHVRWHTFQARGTIFGLFEMAASLVARWRAHLPRKAYLAITDDYVTVLDYRFGPPRIACEQSRWRRHEGRATVRPGNVHSLTVDVDGRTLELEAVTYDEESARVVALLRG